MANVSLAENKRSIIVQQENLLLKSQGALLQRKNSNTITSADTN